MSHARGLLAHFLAASADLKPFLPVSTALSHQGLVTVGAIPGGAYLAKGLVGDMFDDVTDEVKEILAEVDKRLDDLIDDLGATWQDLLGVTVDQLDPFSKAQLLRIHSLIQRVQAGLRVGFENLKDTVLEHLRSVTTKLRTTLAQVEEVVAVSEGGTLIVVVIPTVGPTAFTWLLFTRRQPGGQTSRRLARLGHSYSFSPDCCFLKALPMLSPGPGCAIGGEASQAGHLPGRSGSPGRRANSESAACGCSFLAES